MRPLETRASIYDDISGSDKILIYNTDRRRHSGGIYTFKGWPEDHLPTATFAAGDYVGCLHGAMLAYLLIGDPQRTQLAVEDDGILHELTHMIHFPRDIKAQWERWSWMVDELKQLQEDALKIYEQQLAIQNANTDAAATQQQQAQLVSLPKWEGPPIRFFDYIDWRPELEGTEQGEKEVYQTFTRYRPQDVLPSIAIHQQLLQRPREEESLQTSVDCKAWRYDDLRYRTSRVFPLQSVQQTGEVQPDK